MTQPPFGADEELCSGLEVVTLGEVDVIRRTAKPDRQDKSDFPRKDYLPGEPRILLDGATIGAHLEEDLMTRDLDTLSPHLWLVATQNSAHISSLTHQIVRGREIVVTEKAELHLVWYYDRIFIKPLPKYLLSYAFWNFYFISPRSPIQEPLRSELKRAALGFLRTYAYLVRRRSDFDTAMSENHRLLPKQTKYSSFVTLIRSVEGIDDEMVSQRYHYGDLRLSRLNFWAKIFLFRFTYHKPEGQYGPYFARFYGPILFLFSIFSVLLSTMQVVLAVIPLTDDLNKSWLDFAKLSRGFSVFTLFIIALMIFFLLVSILSLSFRELIFALKDLYKKRQARRVANKQESSIL